MYLTHDGASVPRTANLSSDLKPTHCYLARLTDRHTHTAATQNGSFEPLGFGGSKRAGSGVTFITARRSAIRDS